ncbi:unnamed protein product [Moneuplotes crassus]|uniref:Uncharacterized protein n=1 Tax=Euplotes crassus TaxID=5936 RepID=A0AAD1XDW9_EUPCR|nr:unnamed protein product [Moneuplotes crassus]
MKLYRRFLDLLRQILAKTKMNKYNSVVVSSKNILTKIKDNEKEQNKKNVGRLNPIVDLENEILEQRNTFDVSRRYKSVSNNPRCASQSNTSTKTKRISSQSHTSINKEQTRKDIINLINKVQSRQKIPPPNPSSPSHPFLTPSNPTLSSKYRPKFPKIPFQSLQNSSPKCLSIPNLTSGRPQNGPFVPVFSTDLGFLNSLKSKHRTRRNHANEISKINSEGILNHYLSK